MSCAGESGIYSITVLGMTFVVLGSPAAQHAVMKQQPFLPKPKLYASLSAIVCTPPISCCNMS